MGSVMVGADLRLHGLGWVLDGTAPTDGTLTAEVWSCGDDECDCTQAQICHRSPHPLGGGWRTLAVLWLGDFHTDGEWIEAEKDLTEVERIIKGASPALHARITWPS